MVLKQRLRTREDQFDMLDRTVGAIMREGKMCEKAGTIINAVNAAHGILRCREDHEEFAERLAALEALNGIKYAPKQTETTGESTDEEVVGNA
jgi:hypothetical protein